MPRFPGTNRLFCKSSCVWIGALAVPYERLDQQVRRLGQFLGLPILLIFQQGNQAPRLLFRLGITALVDRCPDRSQVRLAISRLTVVAQKKDEEQAETHHSERGSRTQELATCDRSLELRLQTSSLTSKQLKTSRAQTSEQRKLLALRGVEPIRGA